MCKLLEQRGWVLKRIQGSHHIYARPGSGARISVPVHGSTALKIGLLRSLMKIADIDDTPNPERRGNTGFVPSTCLSRRTFDVLSTDR
nr:type II toxin-antitoxin system HicA family toxin [Lamprobacter modestohalophilus]